MANAAWVAKKMVEDIRANPDIPAKSIQDLLMDRFGLQMKLSTLYRMKDHALKEINGGHDESYKLLPRYCEMVKQTNPNDSPCCRSLIGVDGTHLKGNHGGVLLSAVALDGNNELFPIAVGVVESENKDSWSNFFWHLKQVVQDSKRSDWTIISNRQKFVVNYLINTGVRRTAMVRHATRQHTATSWLDDGVCPNIMTMLRVLRKDSRTCHVYNSTIGEYEVHDGRTQLHVSLNKWTCPCGLWQISVIPCKHAIRAIIFANRDPVDYVSEWYSVRRYKAAYAMSIYPIPDKEQWPTFDVPELEPPSLRRSIGRPSRNRRREPGEQRKGKRSITIKCGKCKCFGHNSKTCKGGYTAREKGEMQGKFSKRKAKMSTGSRVNMFESLNELERVVMGSSQTSENATHVTSTTAMQWQTNNGATSKGTKRKTRE
ncbi:uncharacterized protein LOC141628771 [Silene latifolia]|uniref:uncharacterized protein LOC141628771 n=1 Tax=Silene latifolia TaxID=37657 RepID=UPI003D78971F